MRNKKVLVSLSTIAVIALLIALVSSFAFAETEAESEVAETTEAVEVVGDESEDRVCPVTGEPCTGEGYALRAERQANGEAPGEGEQIRQRLRDGSCEGDPEAAAERQQNRRGGQGNGKNAG